jgi:hypothetical protein
MELNSISMARDDEMKKQRQWRIVLHAHVCHP